MFVTADQLLMHAIGDYVIQSDWMAMEKTKKDRAAAAHALSYALPFLFLQPSLAAFLFIVITHFIIDRWRLARYVCYAKNFLGPREYWKPWQECSGTGYHESRPPWLATWLLIIADNVMHVICNAAALNLLE